MQHDGLYQHNHMLRELLTGQWGETISQTTTGSEFTKQYIYSIPTAINDVPVNLNKLTVVAFIAEGNQEIVTGTEATKSVIYPSSPSFEIAKLEQLIHQTADDKILVKAQINNVPNTSNTVVTSYQLKYIINTDTNTFVVSGRNLQAWDSDNTDLPLISVTLNQAQNLKVSVDKINGDTPSAPYSSSLSVKKDLSIANGIEIKVEIWQDQYGSETTWKLFAPDTETVIAQGGPYPNLSASGTRLQTHTVPISETGCYRFEIYDSYGDGINGGYGAGKYQLSMNGTVFTTSDGKFGEKDIKYIGVNELINSIENILKNANIKNRVENKTIFIDEEFETAQLYDVAGRKVAEINGNQNSMKVAASGIYIIKIARGEQAYSAKVAVK
jgi:hypothetical protein